jgi:hypothetical protein
MAKTVGLSCNWCPPMGGTTAYGFACFTTAFPYSGKPRTAANSVGPAGVQGLSPGTPFFPAGKKGSVYPFSTSLFSGGAHHG